MNRFVVLLRAVNVGGTQKLSMDDLCTALTAAGFETVRSYIASGNILLDTVAEPDEVRIKVNAVLNTQFNISGDRSVVRDNPSFKRLVNANPFKDAAFHRPNMLHVHFLSAAPLAHAETNLTSYKGPERLRLDGQHLYVDYINGSGTSALTGRFLETALGTAGTARNWNTVLKLAEMLGEE